MLKGRRIIYPLSVAFVRRPNNIAGLSEDRSDFVTQLNQWKSTFQCAIANNHTITVGYARARLTTQAPGRNPQTQRERKKEHKNTRIVKPSCSAIVVQLFSFDAYPPSLNSCRISGVFNVFAQLMSDDWWRTPNTVLANYRWSICI